MKTTTLVANKRTIIGKKVKELRKRSLLPAVVYGRGKAAQNLELGYDDFEKVYRQAGENTLINLQVGDEAKNVLIYDTAKDTLNDTITHVDFYEVRMDEKLTAKIPLAFEGESPAVKELGGVLIKAMHEIEVRSLPANLPHEIKVNLEKIKTFEDSVYVKDLEVTAGVELLQEPETMIASVIPPRTEAEMESLKTEVAEKVEDVKVETEEKKAAREQEKQTEEKEK